MTQTVLPCQIYQHIKVFPEVLRHESEESQEGPAEAVKAGVAVVWIPPSFHACVALWAAAEGWRQTSVSQHCLVIMSSDYRKIEEIQQVLDQLPWQEGREDNSP